MTKIDYQNDKTRAKEEAEGSNGRLNVSSRSDDRSYYNSRDEEETYSTSFVFNAAESGEYAAYIKNLSVTKLKIIISEVVVMSSVNTKFAIGYVTGVAAGGVDVTPRNLNHGSENSASASAIEGASAATGITGLTDAGLIQYVWTSPFSPKTVDLKDRLRLGQGAAIAVNVLGATASDIAITVHYYFE